MQAQIAAAVQRFRDAQRRLHRLVESLDEERWNTRPATTGWSVAECVAHLNLTSEAYLPRLREGLTQARALGGPARGRYRLDPMGAIIALATGPLPRIGAYRFGRASTAPAFVPSGALPRDHLLAEFDRLQEEQISLALQAEGLPLGQVKIASPFDPRVRYNLYSCFVILPRHQRRHVEQAERVWNPDR